MRILVNLDNELILYKAISVATFEEKNVVISVGLEDDNVIVQDVPNIEDVMYKLAKNGYYDFREYRVHHISDILK